MISSFISLYSFSTLFIKTNTSWLITESIKALEIKTSRLYFIIATVIGQIFNPIAEPIIPIRISTKEAKAEIEIHPVIVEPKIRKFNVI